MTLTKIKPKLKPKLNTSKGRVLKAKDYYAGTWNDDHTILTLPSGEKMHSDGNTLYSEDYLRYANPIELPELVITGKAIPKGALKQYGEEIVLTMRDSFVPFANALNNGEGYRLPLTAANGVLGTIISPIAPLFNRIPIVKDVAPYMDLTHTRSLFSKDFWSDPNYKYLEHDYSDVSPFLNDALTTLGYTKYAYPAWVGRNFHQRGRYVLNNLYPAGYNLKNKMKSIPVMLTEPFFKNPPHFENGKRPKWYNEAGNIAETRFLNGLIWGRFDDASITKMKKNTENPTFYFDNSELSSPTVISAAADYSDFFPGLTFEEAMNKAKTMSEPIEVIAPDFFTKSGIGGEHSTYTYNPTTKIGMFKDVQKLNPQWLITDPIKRKFKKNSKIYNFLDKLGGKDLSWILGYKPFTYEHPFFFNEDGQIQPFFFNKELPFYLNKDGSTRPAPFKN